MLSIYKYILRLEILVNDPNTMTRFVYIVQDMFSSSQFICGSFVDG